MDFRFWTAVARLSPAVGSCIKLKCGNRVSSFHPDSRVPQVESWVCDRRRARAVAQSTPPPARFNLLSDAPRWFVARESRTPKEVDRTGCDMGRKVGLRFPFPFP